MKHMIAIDGVIHQFNHPESFVRACMVAAAIGLDHLPRGLVRWLDSVYPDDYTNLPSFWSPYAHCKSGTTVKPWAIAAYNYARRYMKEETPTLSFTSPKAFDAGYDLMAELVRPRANYMGDLPKYMELLRQYTHATESDFPQAAALKARALASIQSGDLVTEAKKAQEYITQGVIVG